MKKTKTDKSPVRASSKTLKSSSFSGGLSRVEFDLENKQGDIDPSTLVFVSKCDIYYSDPEGIINSNSMVENFLIVAAGKNIPFYSAVCLWEGKQYSDGTASVIFDLRPPGVYGSDFNFNMLNDGCGNFGTNFNIDVHPEYYCEAD